MADRLTVDGDELEHFMKLLNRSKDSLRSMRKALGSATTVGLGTDDLDWACEEFQDDWKYGTEQLGEQAEDLAKIIDKSKDAYREVDKALEENLKERGRGKSGGGGGAK
ncbi:type VII secretion target [Streptomyces sp. NPDC002853]